jgi:microcystin-dependent protein
MKSYFLAASAAVVAISVAILIDTSAKAQASGPYLGEMLTVPYNFCPMGWVQASGQTLPINQYQALFSLLGNNFGGDGKTNFMLPNVKPVRLERGDATATLINCIAISGVYPSRQ